MLMDYAGSSGAYMDNKRLVSTSCGIVRVRHRVPFNERVVRNNVDRLRDTDGEVQFSLRCLLRISRVPVTHPVHLRFFWSRQGTENHHGDRRNRMECWPCGQSIGCCILAAAFFVSATA